MTIQRILLVTCAIPPYVPILIRHFPTRQFMWIGSISGSDLAIQLHCPRAQDSVRPLKAACRLADEDRS